MKKAGIILLLMYLLTACIDQHDNYTWYELTKQNILADSDISYDSTVTGKYNQIDLDQVVYFANDKKTRLVAYQKDSLNALDFRFSKDGSFELRREYCKGSAKLLFEGIMYKESFFGLSTWWHCNGKLSHRGIRFRNKKVGIWKYWDEEENLINTTNFGNEDLLDSLRLIKY